MKRILLILTFSMMGLWGCSEDDAAPAAGPNNQMIEGTWEDIYCIVDHFEGWSYKLRTTYNITSNVNGVAKGTLEVRAIVYTNDSNCSGENQSAFVDRGIFEFGTHQSVETHGDLIRRNNSISIANNNQSDTLQKYPFRLLQEYDNDPEFNGFRDYSVNFNGTKMNRENNLYDQFSEPVGSRVQVLQKQ